MTKATKLPPPIFDNTASRVYVALTTLVGAPTMRGMNAENTWQP